MACVYRHIRLDKNEPFYIGIGKTIKRAYSKKFRNAHWKSIVSKTKYDIEILMDGLTWEQACEKEKEFIDLYGRRDLNTGTLVNLTFGGDGRYGYNHTEEWKSNKSIKQKEYWSKNKQIITEEQKEKIKNTLSGRKLSEEHKKNISKGGKGRKFTQEHKNKISEKLKGKVFSEERKKNISEGRKKYLAEKNKK